MALSRQRNFQSFVRFLHNSFPPQILIRRTFSAGDLASSGIASSTSPCSLPRVLCPSLEQFKCDWYDEQMPVLIEAAMENWNARSWTLDTLAKRAGHTTVHIELSKWSSEEGRWADFRDLYKRKSSGAGDELFLPNHPILLEDFIEIFLKKEEKTESPLGGYLAQQQLLDELPSLAEGILDPEYTKVGRGVYQRNVWLGPAGTVTPLHRDPYHNILAQVWGKKYIRLYSPSESAKLYPFKTNLYLRNTSQVDIDALDAFKRWPELKNAPYFECSLNAGEMIYIPIKWWHYVRATELSLSVSFWTL